MKSNLALTMALALSLWLSAEVLAGGPTLTTTSRRAGEAHVGVISSTTIQRHWRHPHYRTRGHEFHRHYYDHYSPYNNIYYYRRHDPRSIIIITPSTRYGYHAPATIVTSEPFYCHVHHVGFVSRAGFLDHVSGVHKIPLQTADGICADDNASCVIEGY